MKVLHLPTSVGGNAWALSQGEKALGLTSHVLYQSQNWLGYPGDIVLDRSGRYPIALMKSIVAAFHIPQKYDVLHFNFGSTLIDIPERNINHWDLPLYKNKRLFVTYNGCDARQKYIRRDQVQYSACKYADCLTTMCTSQVLDQRKAKRIQQFEEAGAGFFSLNPDLMHFLPKHTQFLPYTIAGWDHIQPREETGRTGEALHIVHAPNNQVMKGTPPLRKAVENLEKKYPGKIKLTLVEGVPYEKALEIYKTADIIVDQLRIGWYGAFAVEAMKMGVPVMVYLNSDDMVFIPPQMAKDCDEAFIRATEDDVEQVLENLLHQPHILAEKSQAGQEFVHRWHLPSEIAKITKAAYES